MIKPQKNDIWVAPGYQGGQVVYRILGVFDDKIYYGRSGEFRLYQVVRTVRYQIRNTLGGVITMTYPLHKFINKPVGSHGGLRKLAVRPVI